MKDPTRRETMVKMRAKSPRQEVSWWPGPRALQMGLEHRDNQSGGLVFLEVITSILSTTTSLNYPEKEKHC